MSPYDSKAVQAAGRTLYVVLVLVIMAATSAIAGRLLLPDIGGLLASDRSSAPPSVAAPVIACPPTSVVGRYYSASKPAEFLEFRADGTVFMSMGGGAATYAVDGGQVIISTSFLGAARGTFPVVTVVPSCNYSGPRYDDVFFAPGQGTIQGALSGNWSRRN